MFLCTTLQSKDGDKQVTLRVEGDLDGVIKALAKFPVIDMDLQRQSLEEAFYTFVEHTLLNMFHLGNKNITAFILHISPHHYV